MSNNDWWSSPSPANNNNHNNPSPVRQNSYPRSGQTPNRYNPNDELDAEDAKMADSVKFLPSFSSSTAGKLLGGGVGGGGGSGNTPGGGGGLGMSSGSASGIGGGPGSPGGFSPPGMGGMGMGMSSRRSPNTRFGDASSPRATRMRQVNMMDEDMPPTTSLRDSTDTPTRPAAATLTQDLIRPSTLTHSPENTTLLIFGPPLETLDHLRQLFDSLGPVRSYRPGPEGCQWFVLEYEDPVSAAYALRKHGEVVGGRWILGVRVGDVGSPSATPPDWNLGAGTSTSGGEGGMMRRGERQIGTPIRLHQASVMKTPGTSGGQGVGGQQKSSEGYGWDEEEQKGNWILEKLFGR